MKSQPKKISNFIQNMMPGWKTPEYHLMTGILLGGSIFVHMKMFSLQKSYGFYPFMLQFQISMDVLASIVAFLLITLKRRSIRRISFVFLFFGAFNLLLFWEEPIITFSTACLISWTITIFIMAINMMMYAIGLPTQWMRWNLMIQIAPFLQNGIIWIESHGFLTHPSMSAHQRIQHLQKIDQKQIPMHARKNLHPNRKSSFPLLAITKKEQKIVLIACKIDHDPFQVSLLHDCFSILILKDG